MHAYGAAFDNPHLIVACVIGDGEAETGPLATSWHSNKFLNPATDGAVLPILHLNGYKIANPTVLARIPHHELEDLMRGYGYEPFTLEGDDPAVMHQQAAAVFDTMLDRIAAIQKAAREATGAHRAAGVAHADHAHAQRLDGPEVRRRQAGGEHMARAPGAARSSCAKSPSTCASLKSGCAATSRKSSSTTRAACATIWRRLRPRAGGAWA